MIPQDLSESSLLSALDGASIVYFDGRLYETALVVAHEVITYILLSILMLTIRARSYLEIKHAGFDQRNIEVQYLV
jgi:hypothetical protein